MSRTLAADDYKAIRAAHKELFPQPQVQEQEQPEYGRSVIEQVREHHARMELPVSEGGVELTEEERIAVANMYHCNTKRCGWHKSKKCLIAGHCV